MAETGITTTETLSIYDQQLAPIGQLIYQKRSDFMQLYQPQFSKQYSYIAGKAEAVSLHYHSALHHNSLAALLRENYSKDLSAQYTTAGIHKDDLLFEIEGYPIKKYGSQGQQKSFLIALKLSQYELLKQQLQKKPIVLLDDIFDKLDDSRVTQLVQLVTQGHFGQLFITDTHKDRTEAVVQQIGLPYEMIEVKCEPQE